MTKSILSFFNSDSSISAQPTAEETIESAVNLIKKADAVVVGIGSGMSSSAGYNHYHDNEIFREYLGAFAEKYGITSMFGGYYYMFSTPEEEWAYKAAYIKLMHDAPIGRPYSDLRDILGEKEYFVLTTNADMQVHRTFPKDKYCLFQGDFSYLQCSQPCCDELYESYPIIQKICDNTSDCAARTEDIPRCPHCGRIMMPWVRDITFLEGAHRQREIDLYVDFVQKHKNEKVLFLELGVGEMTPAIIKLPFMRMTQQFKNAFYLSVNKAKSTPPKQLDGKAIAVSEDIGAFLEKVRANMDNA